MRYRVKADRETMYDVEAIHAEGAIDKMMEGDVLAEYGETTSIESIPVCPVCETDLTALHVRPVMVNGAETLENCFCPSCGKDIGPED